MNKAIPFTKFTGEKKIKEFPFLSQVSVVTDQKGTPAGFAFGRDAFISLLTAMDDSFEESVSNQKKAYANPAGKLIDLIEEKLTVQADFVKELRVSAKETQDSEWIPLDEVVRSLHV
ncbi:MAG: hypothetical protein AAB553_00885 [Patescibacteria group bacterium]